MTSGPLPLKTAVDQVAFPHILSHAAWIACRWVAIAAATRRGQHDPAAERDR
jgi:hypothetical protein